MSDTTLSFDLVPTEALENVTGAAATTSDPTTSRVAGCDPNSQLLMLMNQISDSIKSLSTNNGGINQTEMLLFMMVALSGGGGGGGYYGPPWGGGGYYPTYVVNSGWGSGWGCKKGW
jgi:hypothetical protein